MNDALGDYSLTLVDSLDTLVVRREEGGRREVGGVYVNHHSIFSAYMYTHIQIMGNTSEFHRAAQLVVDHVSFESCTTVQVFEATIRYNSRSTMYIHKLYTVCTYMLVNAYMYMFVNGRKEEHTCTCCFALFV